MYKSSRHARRFSSVFSTPTDARRFPVVAFDSSEARMPLPRLAMYCAVASSSAVNGLSKLPPLTARKGATTAEEARTIREEREAEARLLRREAAAGAAREAVRCLRAMEEAMVWSEGVRCVFGERESERRKEGEEEEGGRETTNVVSGLICGGVEVGEGEREKELRRDRSLFFALASSLHSPAKRQSDSTIAI